MLVLDVRSLIIHICLLETIQLVVLHQERLLDHRLIRLSEEVVFLDVVLRSNLGQIPLQIATFRALLLWVLV